MAPGGVRQLAEEAAQLERSIEVCGDDERDLLVRSLDEAGDPAVSMTPYALDPAGPDLIILVSGLAAHTRQLMTHPQASALVCSAEDGADSVHALARATLQVRARHPDPGSEDARAALALYVARHPTGEMLASLPDFTVMRLQVISARQIAGFGAARSVEGSRLAELLQESDIHSS